MIDYLRNEETKRKENYTRKAVTEQEEQVINPKFEVANRLGNLLSIGLMIAAFSFLGDYPEISKGIVLYGLGVLGIRYIFGPVLNLDTFIKNIFYGSDSTIQTASVLIPAGYIVLVSLSKGYDMIDWIAPSIAHISLIITVLPLVKFKKLRPILKPKKQVNRTKTNKSERIQNTDNVIKFKRK